MQVAPNSACSRFQRDKLNWNNLQLRTFNSSFSNAFCIKIFIISSISICSNYKSNYKFGYLYRYPILELYLYFEIYTTLERTGTLLCSVTLENKLQAFLHQKLFHLLLVTSLPREHAEMVQLLMVENLRLILSNRNNRVPVLSVNYRISLSHDLDIYISL